MPFGYIGQNQPKQLVKNAGVVDVMHHGILSKKKHIGHKFHDNLQLIG